jgi:hypothetical protein
MDPMTAALNLANAIMALLTKVWDATPKDQQATSAGDVAKTLHNCSAFLQGVQEKINGLVGAK